MHSLYLLKCYVSLQGRLYPTFVASIGFHILQTHKNNFLNTLKHWFSQMDLISHLLFFVHLSNNIALLSVYTSNLDDYI